MRLRTVMLSAAALAGLVGAHVLDYILLVPDPQHRHDVLLQSGHGYLGVATALAAVAGITALGTALALGARGRAHPRHPWLILGGVQATGFVALEMIERLGAGAGFDRTVLAVLALGVVLQFLVAGLATFILGLFAHVGEVLARAFVSRLPSLRAASRVVRFSSRHRAPAGPLLGATSVRGPPLSFA